MHGEGNWVNIDGDRFTRKDCLCRQLILLPDNIKIRSCKLGQTVGMWSCSILNTLLRKGVGNVVERAGSTAKSDRSVLYWLTLQLASNRLIVLIAS